MSKNGLQPRKLRGLTIRAFAASALVLGALGLAAAPAQAAGATGYGNGTVGVNQTITATEICPSAQLAFTATYSNGVTVSAPSFYADINGNATIYWAPTIVGQITQATIGSTCSPVYLGGAIISQTQTTTTVSTPNNAKVGQATKINVTVQSNSPSAYAPTGQVVVKDVNGATLQTMGLTPGSGNGQSYAYYWWTPATSGTFTFQATYSGDTNAATSVSPQDFISATPTGTPITLTHPTTMTTGIPQTLVATVYPTTVQGSAGFTLNGNPISASVPLVNGVATFQWTPTAAGAFTLGANYMTNQGGSGSTTDPITVASGPTSNDVITVTPAGGSTWSPNGTYVLGASSTTNFNVSTLSGAKVTLNDSGPCTAPGLAVVTPASTANCTLSFVSAGGNGYAPVTQTYNVTVGLGQQTATLAAPQSGKVNVGRTLILESPGQTDTNAGQNITWKVTTSKKICALGFPADGSVTVKIKKKGNCTVQGSAPAVPGVWAAYSVTRTYRGK